MDHHDKYIKYKNKYIVLKNDQIKHIQQGGEKYKCQPNADRFKDICITAQNGRYRNKEKCINDCEIKFINDQLLKGNIRDETAKFYSFIKDIIKNEKIDVYIKGGNVLGIALLKIIYDKYRDDGEKFKECFYKFIELELIKDWDFASYTKNIITEEYRDKLDKIAQKYKLVPRAKTYILYQSKRPILLNDKPLFEISVLDSDNYSKLELPLTTMKIKINEYNIKYIFMFAKSFFTYQKKEEFDFDMLKRMIDRINIIVHPHKNGLYDFDRMNKFDKGNINDELIDFIKEFTNHDLNLAQFFITHIEDLFRMLYRLPEKNIPKTIRIKKFIEDELDGMKAPTWLIDTEKISEFVIIFAEKFGKKLRELYIDERKNGKSVQDSTNRVLDFIHGVSFNRLQIEINNKLITDSNMKILSMIVKPLIDEVSNDGINNLEDGNKIVSFFKFYVCKQHGKKCV